MLFAKIIVCLVLQFAYGNSARILGIVPTPSYSHQIPFQPIWRELSLRGHQVTVLTTDPINDPSLENLTEIDLNYVYEFWNEKEHTFTSGEFNNPIATFRFFFQLLIDLIDLELENPKVQKLISNENEHFDLLIVEYFIPIMFAFGEKFKCPMIGMVTLDALNYMLEEFGSPVHPILNQDALLPYVGELNFFQRLTSVLFYSIFPHFINSYTDLMQEVVYKHFGNEFPHIRDIKKNVTMLFSNGDFIFNSPKALAPAVVQIGEGIHIKPLKSLPSNLKEFVDNATDGFIYFSLGSNVKSKDLSEETRKAILETFSELPFRVLWKFELDEIPNKPDNVLISKWMPQQDILRHPNIKLFITQGGYQSSEEAFYCKVPILGIPFIGDQTSNINNMVHKGFGLSIDDINLKKDEFKSKIFEIVQNSKYKKKIEELSDIALDQPMTGLERAIWWSEYVIRHKGARHLRNPGLDIPMYQYYLLDVIGYCLVVLVLNIYAIVIVFKLLFRYFFLRKTKID